MAPPSWRVGLIVPGCPNEYRDCGVPEFTAKGEACAARVVPRGDDNYSTPSGAARKCVRSLGFLRRIVEVPGQDLNGFCWKAELYHGAARHFCPRGEANTTRAQLNLSLLRSSRTQYDGFGILLTVEVDTFEPPIHGPTCEYEDRVCRFKGILEHEKATGERHEAGAAQQHNQCGDY